MVSPHPLSVHTSDMSYDPLASGVRTLHVERAGIDALTAALDGDLGAAFRRAVTTIAGGTGRVIVTGMGKSGHVARKIASTFASTGTPASFVHPAEASHGDLGMVRSEDVILALSWSGETTELSDIVAFAKRFRVALIGMTSNAASSLACACDIALVLPKAEEACPNGLAPTTSTLMQMALGDALAVALLEARGFSANDFKTFHPGGKLGAGLRQVREIMHTGDRLPLISMAAPMRDALIEASAKGFGCVLVTDAEGALQGIVTDGDVRRHLESKRGDGLLEQPVGEVMTRNPATVSAGLLLAEALELIETRKITNLVVTYENRPVGLVHVLDVLRAGVA